MKDIKEYISNCAEEKYLNEGLLAWFKAFLKKTIESQKSRIHNNRVEMYDVDTKKMQFQKEPVRLKEVDKNTAELWADPKVGYPIASDIYKNQNKYLKDGEHTFDPMVQCYFSKDGNNTYSVGLIMYDENTSFIDGYRHILDIEANLIVDNPTEVLKTIVEQFKDTVVKENKDIKGFTSKASLDTRLSGNLHKAGFKKSNSDKEIYIYNI